MNRQFQKGRSGNPNGRPRGSRNFSLILDQILDQPTRLKVRGRQVVMTGRRALATRMIERAVAGDVRIIQLLQRYNYFAAADEPMIIWISEEDARL